MALYLLDTDHMSLLAGGGEPMTRIVNRLQDVALDDYGITIISYEEQVRGWLAAVARAKKRDDEIRCYNRLGETLRDYNQIAVWQYDDLAAYEFEQLQKAKVRVGTKDLKIAAIALSVGATVLTRNRVDFGKVPGLSIEDWTLEVRLKIALMV